MFSKLKDRAERTAHRLGCHVGRFPLEGSLERHLQVVFSSLRINCVLDVGAHEGEYYRRVRDVGYRGRVASFEPQPTSFRVLQAAARHDRQWRGFCLALGAEPAQLSLNVPQDTSFASFLSPNQYLEERFPKARWDGRTVEVPVERLEELFEEATSGIAEPRVFLKMDTQGWDVAVVEGAGAVLPRILALQSEVSSIPIYQGMRGMLDTLERYAELGFQLTRMFPVTVAEDDVSTIEFDCVLVRALPRTGNS